VQLWSVFIGLAQVLYPVGYNVVVYNTEKKTQRFIPLSAAISSETKSDAHASGDITALAVSNGRHANAKGKMLAVAERGPAGRASVSVFDLHSFKRKGKAPLLTSEVSTSGSASCIVFHSCARLCLPNICAFAFRRMANIC